MLLSIVVVIVTELLFELLKVTGKLAESRKPYLSFADDVLERDMYENLFSATGTKDNPFVDLEQVRQVVKINSKASGLKEEEPEVDLNQRLFVELKWKTMEANLDPVAMSVAELVGTRLPVGALQEEKKNTRQGRTKLVRTNVTWDVELTQNEMTRYKRMAQWSAAAYCSEQDILNWSCGPRCTGKLLHIFLPLYNIIL